MQLRILLLFCLATWVAFAPRTGVAADLADADSYRQAQDYMLLLINEARTGNGLRPVNSDALAAQAGRVHAEDMLERNYFSHWDEHGLKPTRRYNLLGGMHALSENIYFAVNGPRVTQDMLDQAMRELMNSPGHRRTILDPAHTHVGIGLALSHDGSRFYLAQEFITRLGGEYSCPLTARLTERIQFTGRIDSSRYFVEHVVIGFEDAPVDHDKRWLNRTGIYKEGEKLFAGYSANNGVYYPDMLTFHELEYDATTGRFACYPELNFKNREGMYYLFLWLRDRQTNEQVLAATVAVEVTR